MRAAAPRTVRSPVAARAGRWAKWRGKETARHGLGGLREAWAGPRLLVLLCLERGEHGAHGLYRRRKLMSELGVLWQLLLQSLAPLHGCS